MGKKTRILEQIKAGETPASEYTGSNLASELAELERSDREILQRYPAASMQAAVEAKLVKSYSARTARFAWDSQKFLACAAALCVALSIPFFILKGNLADRNQPASITVENATVTNRAKGVGSRIYLYKKDGFEAVKLSDSDYVSCGDVVQISYIASGAKYGCIVSIDGNGVVTQHYPEYGYTSAMLETNGEIPLDYSYMLDDAPAFERFLFITGDKPFSVSGIIDAVDSFANKSMSLKADFSNYLPNNTKISEILLLKK